MRRSLSDPLLEKLSREGKVRIEGENIILDKQSPKDILLELSKVYLIQLNDCDIISEVPKKVERMDEKNGIRVIP